MYTPFKGKMLLDVLKLLGKESLRRKIKLIAYGPFTPEVATQNWLNSDYGAELSNNKLAFFTSL
jgi:hypothetical protein